METNKKPELPMVDLGVYGRNTRSGQLSADEFLPQLRGRKAIQVFREMRDNNPTIGAIMYATEQVLRDVDIKVKPSKNPKYSESRRKRDAEFLESVLHDMDHTLDDHISEALSFLTFGFSLFETVYKRREDGAIGVKKLASRAQWTINRFDIDQSSGDIKGVWQDGSYKSSPYIPINKAVYYRTTTLNNDPAGRSILRNAYQPYHYLNKLQSYEAIAIERELHGIPVGRIPADYLAVDASDSHKAFRAAFESVLRDVKLNEQGFILIPSDQYTDSDGKPTGDRIVDIELLSASGSRSIDIDVPISRYQHDIARSAISEFVMLGTSGGSYALSKSKSDLFLRCLEAYADTIADTLNKQLVEPLWLLNGLPPETMPELEAGDVAPHDLKELGSFLRNLNGADIGVGDQVETVAELLDIAELPFDKEQYKKDLADRKAGEKAQQEADLATQQANTVPSDNTTSQNNTQGGSSGEPPKPSS